MSHKARELVHASVLLVPIVTEVASKIIALTAVGIVTVAYIVEEILRLRGQRLPFITSFTLRMSRLEEQAHFIARPVYLAVGTMLALLLFPNEVAYASIAIVAIGDPVAAYVGGRFGRTRIGRKTLEGFAAGLLTSFLAASFLVPVAIAGVGATVAMLFELLGVIDDNLTMPIAAGATMFLVSSL